MRTFLFIIIFIIINFFFLSAFYIRIVPISTQNDVEDKGGAGWNQEKMVILISHFSKFCEC